MLGTMGLGGRRRLSWAAPTTAAKVTKCWMGKWVPGARGYQGLATQTPPTPGGQDTAELLSAPTQGGNTPRLGVAP